MPKVKNQKQKSKASLKANALEKATKANQQTMSVGIAEGRAIPRVYFKSLKPSDDADMRYHGCDFMGSLASSSSAATIGSNGIIYAHNATLFPRLSAIADLFVRYRFRRLRWYVIGESATTQAGSGAFGSYVNDMGGGTITINTDAIIRNSEGVIILRGWESGVHEVDCKATGLRWMSCDADAGSSAGFGAALGQLFSSIPQTSGGSGLLTWSVYLEYDIEFAEAFSGSGIDLLKKKLIRALPQGETVTSNPTQPSIEQLVGLLDRLK